MEPDNFTDEIAEARAEYFRAADAALEKIRLRFGDGREGFLNFLNNKAVGKVDYSQENISAKKENCE